MPLLLTSRASPRCSLGWRRRLGCACAWTLEHLAREMNVQAAILARAACDRFSTTDHPRFVAGAIGPTPRTASISPDVNDPGARRLNEY